MGIIYLIYLQVWLVGQDGEAVKAVEEVFVLLDGLRAG